MPRYITDVDRWISHENRMILAGSEFETEFPAGPGGKPMRLSDTLRELPPVEAAAPKSGAKRKSGDELV
jgi:hypothetical protein